MKILSACVAALLAGATFAAVPGGASDPGPGAHRWATGGPNDPIARLVRNPEAVRAIGLTDEQKAKIAEIDGSGRNPEPMKSLRASSKRLAELLQAEKIDEAAVMAEIDRNFDLQREMAKDQVRRIVAIRAVLTREQIQKAREVARNKAAARRARLMKNLGTPEAADGKPPKPEAAKTAPSKD